MQALKPFCVKGVRSGQVALKPEESIGEHSTKEREEFIFIFEGRARVSTDKVGEFTAEESNLIYIPPNTMHNVTNVGTKLLRYIYIVSPVRKD